MEPMLNELESALDVSKKRLKEESRLRRQAEIAQVEMEARFQESETNLAAVQQENESLREECEALHEELDFKCRELESYKRQDVASRKELQALGHRLENRLQKRDASSTETSAQTGSATDESGTPRGDSTGRGDSTVDDSYAEVLDELEGVTEQLIATQQKLWQAEDRLRESESRVRLLESSHKQLERETDGNARNSLLDASDGNSVDVGDTVNEAQQNLAIELSQVKKQLAAARQELRVATQHEGGSKRASSQREVDRLKDQIDCLKEEAAEAEQELERIRSKLEESTDENATLVEEIACLREILQDKTNSEIEREELTAEIRSSVLAEAKEQREHDRAEANKTREAELSALREKLKKIVKENAALRNNIDQLERGVPPSYLHKGDVSQLKKEVSQLKETLKLEREEKSAEIEKVKSIWQAKLEAAKDQMDDERGLALAEIRGEMMEERSAAVHTMQERLETISGEKFELEQKIEKLEKEIQKYKQENSKFAEEALSTAEQLKTSKNENLTLKKKAGMLSTDLEHTKRTLGRVEAEAQKVREQYADVCAELEVAKQILDEAGLEEETIARENETELKKQIHSLSKSLEQLRQDYAELENDFLDNQHRFCDSQEEASRQSDDEIQRLTKKITELEDSLECARQDQCELSVQLEEAKKECHETLNKEKQVRQSLEELKEKKLKEPVQQPIISEEVEEGSKLTMKDLRNQLTQINEELNECKVELEAVQTENARLKDELQNSQNDGFQRVKVLDKFFARSSAPDPEPVEDGEGVEVVRTSSKEGIKQWKARDPPTTRSELLGKGSVSRVPNGADLDQVRSQLMEVALENEFLRDKIVSMHSSNDAEHSKELSSSSSMAASEIMEQIKALQEKLENTEKTSEELEEMAQRLTVSETRLAATEEELTRTLDENGALKGEILALKDAIREARQNVEKVSVELEIAKSQNRTKSMQTKDTASMEEVQAMLAASRSSEFNELRDQCTKLTEEKATLQHLLDDSKIALSVAEYAQERSKEELRATASKLSSSTDEVFRLQHELKSLSRSLSDMKYAYDNVMSELRDARERDNDTSESRKATASLTRQLQQIRDENGDLKQTVAELEGVLSLTQRELDNKTRQVTSLHDSLLSTQEETRLLTEEITHLTNAFETAKAEYNNVVDELEAVNELFDEAREEAERSGKDAAMEQLRKEMHASREKERSAMKEQIRRVFEENASLQRQLNEVEKSLVEARNMQKTGQEIVLIKKEVKVLKDALQASADEVKTLREKEFHLNLELREYKNELRLARQELELALETSDDSRRFNERTASAISRVGGESKEHKELREHLKKLIEETERESLKTGSSEVNAKNKSEGLRLKVELLDMSMTLEKILEENVLIEEELERVRKEISDAKKEGRREGLLEASKEMRKQMKEEREKEMKEFKAKFNELVEENSVLGEKLRNSELRLMRNTDSKHQGTEALAKLQRELSAAKAESAKFQQEVLHLTVELETANEDHEQAVKELKSSSKADKESKVKSLQNKLNLLSVENTTLQQKLRSAESILSTTRTSEARSREEMESLLESLRESQAIIRDLEDQVSKLKGDLRNIKSNNDTLHNEKADLERKLADTKSALEKARAGSDKSVQELRQELQEYSEENSKLKLTTSQLKQTLESSTRELDHLREQFDRVCTEVTTRDNSEASLLRAQLKKLSEEKAAIQQQVDEAKITLSLQKYAQDRNVEELKIYQDKLQSNNGNSNSYNLNVAEMQKELSKAKEDVKDAMEAIRQINQLLDAVDGVHGAESTQGDGFSDRAKEIKAKVCVVLGILEQARKERATLRAEVKKSSTENLLKTRRIEASETAMEAIRQAQLKDKMELELLDLKHKEAKREATGHLNEISRLKTALEYAQQDHASLRQQLEVMNSRMSQMCTEAEERGKAAASQQFRGGISNLDEKDRKELMGQFRRFYEENLDLQGKLDKLEGDLAASRDSEGKHKAVMEQMEREANEKTEKLEAANKRLNQELESLREGLNKAKANRTAVVRELGVVKERLAEMTALKAAELTSGSCDSIVSTSEKDAEIRLLQDQFKKLSMQSVTLGQKVEDAEQAVSEMRMKQERTKAEASTLDKQAQRLQLQVEKAVEDSTKRDQEIGDLSSAMVIRVSMAEENMNRLERDISVAKGKLQVTEAGLLVLRRRHTRGKGNTAAQQAKAKEFPEVVDEEDEDSSIKSEEQRNSESREDVNQQSARRLEEAKPEPKEEPVKATVPMEVQATVPVAVVAKDTSLTTRALEAIAQSKKKNTLRKFDIRAAQNKILGSRNTATKEGVVTTDLQIAGPHSNQPVAPPERRE